MKLDRHTYEAWLLDRLEGNLTPDQEQRLDAFLAANPDLSPAPFDELPRIQDVGPGFPDKEALLRSLPPVGPPRAELLDDHLAARLEGDLDPGQEQALDRYLYEHPEAARQARLMGLTKLTAHPVPYPAKQELLRTFPPQGEPDRYRITDFLIAAHEGDLDLATRRRLDVWMAQHPEAAAEDRLVRLARVLPQPVRFPEKDGLYKREAGRVIAWPAAVGAPWGRWAAAASLLLLLGAGAWWIGRDSGMPTAQVATLPAEPAVNPGTSTNDGTPEPPAGSATIEAAPTNEPAELIPGTTPRQMIPDPSTPRHRTLADPPQRTSDPLLASTPHEQHVGSTEAPAAPNTSDTVEPVAPMPHTLEQEPMLASVDQRPMHHTAAVAVPSADRQPSSTLGDVILQRVRERLHDAPAPDAGPLSGSDAVAAIDKGLRQVAGEHAGLSVERDGRRLTRLDLRLGKGLAMTASRGH